VAVRDRAALSPVDIGANCVIIEHAVSALGRHQHYKDIPDRRRQA
jgi:hypothetical protein